MTFSLISDGFLRPSSCRRGRWEESGCEITCYVLQKWQHVRGQQLFHPSVLPWHVDRRSSRLLPHYRIRGRGGGLNCEAKAQVLVVTPPPPLFFLKVGRKKGGRNSGAVRYIPMASTCVRQDLLNGVCMPQIYLKTCL